VDCLTEIASLPPADIPENYRPTMQLLLASFMQQLVTVIPPDVDLCKAFDDSSEEDCLFIKRLALFLSTYLKSFLPLFEQEQADGRIAHEELVVNALMYMVMVSQVNDEEIFKTCLEFWHHFSKELYTAEAQWKGMSTTTPSSSPFTYGAFGSSSSMTFGQMDSDSSSGGSSSNGGKRPKHIIYESVLHRLRIVMIDRMAKPEEVIIVEDDNGEIVREQTKDTEVIAQYKVGMTD
jgi:exportin-1